VEVAFGNLAQLGVDDACGGVQSRAVTLAPKREQLSDVPLWPVGQDS